MWQDLAVGLFAIASFFIFFALAVFVAEQKRHAEAMRKAYEKWDAALLSLFQSLKEVTEWLEDHPGERVPQPLIEKWRKAMEKYTKIAEETIK